MADDLVAFLRARLDEDEQTARATMWEGSGNRADWSLPASATVDTGGDTFYASDRTLAAHIARHDPARVLREVEANRRIVDASAVFCPAACSVEHTLSGSCELRWMGPARPGEPRPSATPESVLRLLASIYADHPNYREEWRP